MRVRPGFGHAASLCCMFVLWVGGSARAAAPSVDELSEIIREQRALIDAQQQAIASLQRRVGRLEGETVQGARRAEPEQQGVDRAGEDVEPLDFARETDRMEGAEGLHLTIPRAHTKLSVSGFVKADLIHDFREIDSPSQFITSEIVVPGGSRGQTTFSSNPSRLVVGSATSTRMGRLTTMFSMDFFGEPAGRGPVPRLRQAWGQLEGLLLGGGIRVGQSWSSWDDLPALPETLDFQGPNGSDQTRHTLLRWVRPIGERWTIWAAVEDPESDIEGGESDTRWPDGVLSVTYAGEWGHVKPAVLFRDIGAESDAGGSRAFGWGLSASGLVKLPWLGSGDDLRFQLQYGEGIGFYVNDGVADAVVSGSDIELLPVFTGYLALQHWWFDRLRSNAVFGWVDVENQGIEPESALDRTLYAAGNLIWTPVPPLDLGVELLWGQRRNKGGADGHDPRLQFSAKFRF